MFLEPVPLAVLAESIQGDLDGNADILITGLAGIREATPGELTYIADRRYAAAAESTGASAIILGRDLDLDLAIPVVRCDEPEKCFYRLAASFAPPPPAFPPGIHPSAVVSKDAVIGADVHIGAQAVVESGTVIGDRSVIGALVYIGTDCRVGSDCLLYPHVAVREYTQIGDRVIVHCNTTLGSDGFGFYTDREGFNHKIPQTGIVIVEDDVEIGASVAVDRARFGVTRIEKNAKIDNLVQIAHNCTIGAHSMMASHTGFSGSTLLGKHCLVAGQVGTAGHLVIGDRSILMGRTGVTKNLEGGQVYAGFPARPHMEDRRIQAQVARLSELRKKVNALEKRLDELSTRD